MNLEYQGLLADIRANPDEDTPRLILADWLEEHGDETGRLQGEFIRVQIDLVRLLSAQSGEFVDARVNQFTLLVGLRRREIALAQRLAKAKDRQCEFASKTGVQWLNKEWPDRYTLTVERGFARSVECPLVVWQWHGAELWQEQPLQRVVITDRAPQCSPDRRNAAWWTDSDFNRSYSLPGPLFDLLDGYNEAMAISPRWKNWHSPGEETAEALAMTTLSDACLALASAQHGRQVTTAVPGH